MTWSKESPASRGYGASWRVLRERVLARDRHVCCCERCRAAGRISVATEVDHIVSKAAWMEKHGTLDGVDDESNLQAISKECHGLKTVLDAGHSPRLRFDANGWPIGRHHWNDQKD